MIHKCDYADERNSRGYCAHKRVRKCDGCGDVFAGLKDAYRLTVIERKDICKESSLFGNYYIKISADDIAALIAGKCLGLTGEEYNIFISFDGGEAHDL